MAFRATSVGEATEALMEVRARLCRALEAVDAATAIVERREVHVKRALDILGRGDETRDLKRQMKELGILETDCRVPAVTVTRNRSPKPRSGSEAPDTAAE